MKKNIKKILLVSIIIFIITIITIVIVLIINKNNKNEKNSEYIEQKEIQKINSIIENIKECYYAENTELIGKKKSYSEVKNINQEIKLKIVSNYDGYDDVEPRYYYYEICNNDLKEYGISDLKDKYIINYSTGEVINISKTEYENIEDIYTYSNSLEDVDILNGETEIYTITYDLDGGQFSESYSRDTYDITMEYKLKSVEKEGYMFKGWTGSNGKEPEIDVTIEQGSKGNKTYKANWEKIEEVKPVYLD